jgi:S1-C subfamily serine protease
MPTTPANLSSTPGLAYLAALLVCIAAPLARAQDAPSALELVRADEDRRCAALAAVSRTVVCVFEDQRCTVGGAGVLIDSAGYGLTNFHVVAAILDSRRAYGGLADGRLYPLRVIGIDPGGDIALFKLEHGGPFEYATFADADQLRVGQWLAALGNPFLLAEDFIPTITLGVVSGLHRYQYGAGNLLEYADCVQVSASINPGNSGGPIVDLAGHVVAIAGRASFEERGRVNVGLAYGVPINQVRRFMPALRAGRMCLHGTLGTTVQLISHELIFNAVQEFSPAGRAGIELGDVLLSINSQPVRTPNEFNNAIASLPAGWPVAVGLRRGGQELVVQTRLAPLALPNLPVYIPALADNHAEIRRLLADFAGRDVGRAGLRAANITCEVSHEAENGQLQPSWPSAAVAQEWHDFVTPLLNPPDLDVTWEALGGDEVEGRIVSVIEQRLPDGRRLRWKLDFDTGDLRAVTIGDATETELVTWQPEARRRFGDLRWPAKWVRETAAGEHLVIHVDELRIEVVDEPFDPEAKP